MRGPLLPLRREPKPAPRDWLDEFPEEAAPDDPVWIEVPHARIAPPPHTRFKPFSLRTWIWTHRSMVRAGALGLAAITAVGLGMAWWTQREAQQPLAVAQSASSEPLLERPVVTPPPVEPTVFTSEAAAPPLTPAPSPASNPGERTTASPAREKAAPPARGADATSGRTTTASSSRGYAPPLPPAAPPARARETQAPPPDTALSISSATVTTSRPPVDRAPLIISSPPEITPVPTPVAKPAPAAVPAPPLSPEARETAAVEGVLERYRFAFSTLNSGVSDFWPGVNSRALDKAFNELVEQRFEFDQCRVQVKGSQADATCTGRATFVTKVGDKTPRSQPRQWVFRLVQVGNRWIIDSVQSR